MHDEDLLYVKLFNTIYEKYGFKGIIEEIRDRLEYGNVKEENGLIRITTGGWSDDETLIHTLTHPISKFRKHYRGYIVGGAFYFSREPYAEVKMYLHPNGVDCTHYKCEYGIALKYCPCDYYTNKEDTE